MQPDGNLVRSVQSVLRDRLLIEVSSPEIDLLETGLVDSIGLVELILELEERFRISLPMENLEIDDFRSVGAIAELVARYSSAPVGAMAER